MRRSEPGIALGFRFPFTRQRRRVAGLGVRQHCDRHMTAMCEQEVTEATEGDMISVTSVTSCSMLFLGLRGARLDALDRRIAGSRSAGSDAMGRGDYLADREHSARP